MVDESRILSLVRLTYEAVEAPEGWNSLLSALSATLHAQVATLDVYDTAKRQGNVAAAVNLDPSFGLTYATHFAAKNLWQNHRPHLILPGRAVTGQMLVPDEILFRSEFYQDLLRHEDIFHLIGARILEKGPLTANLSLFRPRERERFGGEELAVLQVLLPHLQQAIRLSRHFAELDALARLSRSVLDRVPVGVFLLDGFGRPVVLNKAAEEILALRDGLSMTSYGLKASGPKENAALSALVLQAISAARGNKLGGLGASGILPVSRPSCKRPFLVEVVPYAPQSGAEEGNVSVAVFVSDPEALVKPSHLGCAFGLTPAEETLAVRLAQGETLEAAADESGVSLNTARTHLKHIFAKTGVGRQSELIRLLLTGVTGLRPSR